MRAPGVSGRGGTLGKGGNLPSGRVPSEAPNTLQSRSTARFLDVWCEGPIEGLVDEDKSIFFNDTPLQNDDGTWNFNGIAWDTRYGLPFGAQSYMAGFPTSKTVVQVGSGIGNKVTHAAPQSVTFTDSAGDMDAVIVKLSIPALYDQTNNDGSVKFRAAEYKIWLKTGAGVFDQRVHQAFDGKCTSTYQRDHRIALPAHGPGTSFTLKVERPGVDIDQTRVKDEFYFTSYTKVTDGKLVHPNVAYAGIQIDTAQFSGSAPTRAYDIKGLKIKYPSNYDPTTRKYTGAWDGTFSVGWTDNPAWCFYDLLSNTRYGLGLPATAIDPWKWDLYSIAQYCDGVVASGADMVFEGVDDGKGVGTREPRFACNLCLNSRQEAFAAVNTLASIFRGMPFWSAGAVRPVADMPKSPVALFTNSNVVGGQFKYEGTSLKSRHTVAKVVWNDPADGYKAAVEFVEDAAGVGQYGVRQVDIVASGCTSRGQAIRAGKWVLDTERTATESVHFQAGLDAADKFPGDIVSIADENYAQKVIGGRATAATTTSLAIDAPFTIVAGHAYTLKVMLPDGSLATRTLTNSAGATSTLTWGTALAAAPLAGAVWAITETSLATREFMIVSSTEVKAATFELMAVLYDAGKFGRVESGILAAPQTYNATPTGAIGQPSNLTSVLHHATVGSAIATSVIVSWERALDVEQDPADRVPDARVYAYDVQVRGPDHSQWQDVGVSSVTSIEYADAPEGVYDFRVRAKALNGRNSAWVELLAVALTSQIQPSDVGGLVLLQDTTGVAFKWNPVPDLNVSRYEIREGASWAAGTVVATTPETFFARQGLPVGTYTYWVAAVTSPQGTYSAHPQSLAVTVAIPGSPNVTATIAGTDFKLAWPPVVSARTIDRYDLYYGPALIGATLLGSTKATTFQAPIDWNGARVFWIVPTDIAGVPGVAVAATVFVTPPAAPATLAAQIVDNGVVLKWTVPAATLPIAHYLVKRGATAATSRAAATVIGQKQGTFTTTAETIGGTYVYWVAAVDSAGNEGTPVAVVATVAGPPDYIVHASQTTSFGGTKTNLAFDPIGGGLIGPIDTAESWTGHFTTNGWASPQAQIDAGKTYYLQPPPSTAQYVETFDVGATIASAAACTLDIGRNDIVGTVGMTATMEKSTNGTSWTTVGTGQVQNVENFRYIRVTLDFTSTGGAFFQMKPFGLRIDAKEKTDTGTAAVLGAGDPGYDAAGTPVAFAKSFGSIKSIQLTAAGTAQRTAVYSFAGGANPTGFKILLFDDAGTRVSGTVSWTARGV
ncbi:MAG: phage tail protein [Reyranellaceae bacterium]